MAELDLGKVVMDSYNDLDDKPSINGVELNGELKTSQFGIDQAIEAINLARLNFKEFNTLEEFVNKTAKENDVPHFSTMWDGGGWGPLKRATHYKYLIAYEGRYNNPGFDGVIRDDVRGSGLFWDDENNIWYVTIQGNVGTLTFSYFKIEPNQIPTNNLLATEAGTPLDAVQGKVLDDEIAIESIANNIHMFTMSGETTNISELLKETGMSLDFSFQENMNLLKAINAKNMLSEIFIFCNSNNSKFNMGLPVAYGGFLTIIYPKQNRRFFQFYDYRTGNIYSNYDLDGTFGTWEMLATVTELKNWLKLIYNHKEYIPWTSIASGSYAAGEKRYTKTDIWLIKELLFVFQENSVYESMAYEYVSITTGYGNLTTGYYQAQTTKGLFRIYYSEEGYIDIREVPNGLGIRAALYLPKI